MAYTKITVESGEVIESSWGNHIQTQYDEAVSYADGLDKNDIGLGNVLNEEQATKSAFDTHTENSDIHFLKGDVTKSDVDLGNVLNKEQLGVDEKASDSTLWDGYEVQKDGTDGTGIINFKTE